MRLLIFSKITSTSDLLRINLFLIPFATPQLLTVKKQWENYSKQYIQWNNNRGDRIKYKNYILITFYKPCYSSHKSINDHPNDDIVSPQLLKSKLLLMPIRCGVGVSRPPRHIMEIHERVNRNYYLISWDH